MKNKFALIILLFWCMSTKGQQLITLQQSIETGIKNNFDVNQAGLLVKKENINLNQSRSERFPDLNANASYGTNNGRSIDPFTNQYVNQGVSFSNINASSSVLLFNGFFLSNLIRSNKSSFEASQKELQQAKDNLTLNIILAYLNVLKAEDVLEQSKQQIVVSQKQVDRLNILNNEGSISPSELYNLKGQSANDELAVSDNEASVLNAKLNLTQLMNISFDKSLEVEKISLDSFSLSYEKTPAEIYQKALQNFAQIQAAELRVKSAESHVSSSKGGLFPTLSLGGNINTNFSSVASRSLFLNDKLVTSDDYITVSGTDYPVMKNQSVFDNKKINFSDQLSNNLFTTVSLNLSIPLFNANRVRSNIRFARLDLQSYSLIEDHAKMQLQQAIEKAYVDMMNSKSRIHILENQVHAYDESFKSAEIRFNAGVITSVEYLEAKNNFDRSRINLITSKYDYALRKKVLDYYEGNQLW